MSIYRRTANGKRSRFFTAEFRFRKQLHRKGGFADRESAKDWLMTESLRLRRAATGYVKPLVNAEVAPLIEDFGDYLTGKGRDEMYTYTSRKRLTVLAGECGWLTLGHVSRESLEQWLASESKWKGHVRKAKTKNQFAAIAMEWGKWLKRAGKLPANPLADVEMLPEKSNPWYRRAATEDELNRLLATCSPARRVAHTFRLYCPLRRKTVRRLTWRMMRLDDERPWIALPAELNKSKRDERSPIPLFLAQVMRAERKRVKAKADALVFDPLPTLDDLRDDLKAAGIAFDDGKGQRRLDYHAFRKTLIRMCKRAGVSLDDASLLLHHKSTATTRKHYDDDLVAPELSTAIDRLPEVGKVRKAQ